MNKLVTHFLKWRAKKYPNKPEVISQLRLASAAKQFLCCLNGDSDDISFLKKLARVP